MELHEVRYVLCVNATMNFTRAAQLCHVSQPALSRAIQKLESEMGGALFQRSNKGVRMTELGYALETTFRQLAYEVATAKSIADTHVAALQGAV